MALRKNGYVKVFDQDLTSWEASSLLLRHSTCGRSERRRVAKGRITPEEYRVARSLKEVELQEAAEKKLSDDAHRIEYKLIHGTYDLAVTRTFTERDINVLSLAIRGAVEYFWFHYANPLFGKENQLNSKNRLVEMLELCPELAKEELFDCIIGKMGEDLPGTKNAICELGISVNELGDHIMVRLPKFLQQHDLYDPIRIAESLGLPNAVVQEIKMEYPKALLERGRKIEASIAGKEAGMDFDEVGISAFLELIDGRRYEEACEFAKKVGLGSELEDLAIGLVRIESELSGKQLQKTKAEVIKELRG